MALNAATSRLELAYLRSGSLGVPSVPLCDGESE